MDAEAFASLLGRTRVRRVRQKITAAADAGRRVEPVFISWFRKLHAAFDLGARIWRVAHGDFKLGHPRKGTEGPRVHLSNTMADRETILLFCVDATRAKGLNNDLEIVADNLIYLRKGLADQLDRLGVDGKIVGIRTDAPTVAV